MTATASNMSKKSSKNITAIRGMNDILPDEISYWQFIEQNLRQLANSYGYKEVRLPTVESTELFKRSVGDVTDIVEKEMYSFADRNGDNLTLRPEGTAGLVRAGIEHSLFYGQQPKLWYLGPMFRHERPQKGRYRQFYQFGLEAFGNNSPYLDVELLAFCARLWELLGLEDKITLELNCLGSQQERKAYTQDLVAYFKDNYEQLDADSQRRLERNPLRILDSKNPELASLITAAPKLSDYWGDDSQEHLNTITNTLDKLNIKYKLNPYLVRGLDYYCLTVFEWVTDELGAQGTVCAGGRYDNLVEQLGGQSTPAIGFSMGMERLTLMLKERITLNDPPDCFIALVGESALAHGVVIAEQIRTQLPGLELLVNTTGQSFKNQLKKADKSGAKVAIIIGDDEVSNGSYTVKFLREQEDKTTQQVVINNTQDLINLLQEL